MTIENSIIDSEEPADRVTADYGHWRSPIAPASALSRPGNAQWPERHGDDLYWIQSLPEQGGRLVLMRWDETPGTEPRVATPAGFNIRTRVHEYGGRCHLIIDDNVYFVNFDDQVLYRQSLVDGAEPVALTLAADDAWMLADPVATANGWLVFVGERRRSGQENENALVGIKTDARPQDDICVIVDGDDFYACPVVTTTGDRLAFFSWSHPHMPWDESSLWVADLHVEEKSIAASALRRVAGGPGESVCQLLFRSNGDLVFARDGEAVSDYWNLCTLSSEGGGTADVSVLTSDSAEYGVAHWVFGHRRVVEDRAGRLLAARTEHGSERLVVVGTGTENLEILSCDAVRFDYLHANADGSVLAVAEFLDRDAAIVEIAAGSKSLRVVDSGRATLEVDDVSLPTQISVPTRDGATTYAWSYAPKNGLFEAPPGRRPPLMVLVHGGPTSRAVPTYDLTRQYWTSRGFAVVDVNHRGSTGFGRRYRQSLLGGWGETDVDDVADVVNHLVDNDRVDGRSVFIRGSSAGGYAVLRALTRHPVLFAAGACYYGIGNLTTLARSTHKFESRYLDGLLGEAFDDARCDQHDNVYFQRSPINFIKNLARPMILFQGSEDRVVPPAVSREVVKALEALAIHHVYVEYPGEGHGFRIAENRIDALTRETEFLLTELAKIR